MINEDGLIEQMIQKVTGIKKKATEPKVIQECEKVITWLLSDRSLQQHRMCFKYLSFLFSSYHLDGQTFEDFLDDIKLQVGYCKKTTTKTTVQGEKITLIKYKPKSLSFAKCSQKVFNEFFERLKDLFSEKCPFPLWLENHQDIA